MAASAAVVPWRPLGPMVPQHFVAPRDQCSTNSAQSLDVV